MSLVNLPHEPEVMALWDCLHDGIMTRIESDIDRGFVQFEFEVFYINKFHDLPADTRFSIRIDGVRSALIAEWAVKGLPDGFADLGREEQSSVVNYRNKHEIWHSRSWAEFAEKAPSDAGIFECLNAEFVRRLDLVSLLLEGRIDDSGWWKIEIVGERESVQRSDGKKLTLAEFLALGEAYWAEFSARSLARQARPQNE